MHPALSKAERKRYAGFDPDKWYDWTSEISHEFSELMRRSPRDTGFARGLAYVAQKAIPEGRYVPTAELLDYIADLPAAFRGTRGSGYNLAANGRGRATVSYAGMPGFNNVCIAIQGELAQRLEASGAKSVVVRHGDQCRLNGSDHCTFEVEWQGESAPKGANPVTIKDVVGDAAPANAAAGAGNGTGAQQKAAAPAAAQQPQQRKKTAQPAAKAAAVTGGAATETKSQKSGEQGSMQESQDQQAGNIEDALLSQLKERLSEADRHFRLYMEAKEEVEQLRLELAQVKAQSEANISEINREKQELQDALGELKQRVRALVSDA